MGTLGDFKLDNGSTTTASETVIHDNLKKLEQSPPLSVKRVAGIKLSPMRFRTMAIVLGKEETL